MNSYHGWILNEKRPVPDPSLTIVVEEREGRQIIPFPMYPSLQTQRFKASRYSELELHLMQDPSKVLDNPSKQSQVLVALL